ncbi:MAG: XdhC/CoxI family protein [Actinomycetota bacterium]|nr:XdhC/CoxI family protein [Actinomycetota bacterium]
MSGPGRIYAELSRSLRAGEPVALATITELEADPAGAGAPGATLGAKLLVRAPAERIGSLGSDELDRVVERDALAALERGTTVTRHYGSRGEARRRDVSVFVEVFAPPPRLVIFGAVDFTAALAAVGRLLGFRVTVCDARPVFATAARFPSAHEVVVDWPDRYLRTIADDLGPRDAICVLTHDTKFDIPAIVSALETEVGYLGAMGSRRTHDERWRRLVEAGADEAELRRRLMSPIGLDIGARTPEETAVAIAAEMIASRAGVEHPSLRDAGGPIHQR